MIKIFLDDERTPRDVTWIGLDDPKAYTIARNFKEFRDLVLKALEGGYVPEVSFDHDLADFYDLDSLEESENSVGSETSTVREGLEGSEKLTGLEYSGNPEITKKSTVRERLEIPVTPDISKYPETRYGVASSEDHNKMELTGFSCMKFLTEAILDYGLHKEATTVFHTFHTKNPVMIRRMADEWEFFVNYDFEDL